MATYVLITVYGTVPEYYSWWASVGSQATRRNEPCTDRICTCWVSGNERNVSHCQAVRGSENVVQQDASTLPRWACCLNDEGKQKKLSRTFFLFLIPFSPYSCLLFTRTLDCSWNIKESVSGIYPKRPGCFRQKHHLSSFCCRSAADSGSIICSLIILGLNDLW